MRKELYKVSFAKYHCTEYQPYTVLADSLFFNKKRVDEFGNQLCSTYEWRGKTKYKTEFTFKENHSSEQFFVDNFANPLCHIQRENLLIVVEKEGHKLSIKLFYSYKIRRNGVQYFQTGKNVDYITVNTVTGDIYKGFLHGYQRKRKVSRHVRKNWFYTDFFNNFKVLVKSRLNHFNASTESDAIFTSALNAFFENIDGNNEKQLTHGQRLYKYYMMKRGIKFPNNFGSYLNSELPLPTLKVLRKNDMKLVDSFMKLHEISGKKLRKALHSCQNINLKIYKNAVNFFGEDWINQNEDVLLRCLNFTGAAWNVPTTTGKEIFSNDELKRAFEMFKLVLLEQLDYSTYFDHVTTYVRLKVFGEEELRWYATNINEFREEHLDWSDKLQHYVQGTYYRIYPEYMDGEITKPIQSGGDTYYPVLLTNSSLYNSESQLQSNCVKGYVGRVGSIIVSFRKGSVDSDIRGTIEYYLSKEEDKLKIRNVQCLGRFNSRLTEEWNEPVRILDERMGKIIKDKRFDTVKLKKVCKNGTELMSDSEWVEDILVWKEPAIENSYYNNIDF
jgi:hypothetical protein